MLVRTKQPRSILHIGTGFVCDHVISPSELWPWRGYQKEIIRRHQCTSELRFAFYQFATVALGQPKTRLSTYGEKASCSTLRRVCKGYVDISRVQRHQPSNELCHEARLALIAYTNSQLHSDANRLVSRFPLSLASLSKVR